MQLLLCGDALTVDSERSGRFSSPVLVVEFTSVQANIIVINVKHRQSCRAVVSFHSVLGSSEDLPSVAIPGNRPYCR